MERSEIRMTAPGLSVVVTICVTTFFGAVAGERVFLSLAFQPMLHEAGGEAEASFGSEAAEASFSKNLGSEASAEASAIYIYIFIFFCIYTQNKHPKYQINCRRHENMHIFA